MSEEILKTLLQDGDIHKDKDSEELIFNPFNSNNKEINENVIQTILKKYGVKGKIHNINLYKRAFIHKSYVKRPALENETNGIQIVDKPFDCLPLKTKSNERLEFLGDGVLECIIKYYLYRRFPKENEGFMTEKKIALVKNETIGRFAYEIGLNKWYIISRHAEEKKIRTNLKHEDSTDYKKFGSFENIQTYFENHETCFVFLAKSKHKIKKKAEQVACKDAINIFNK